MITSSLQARSAISSLSVDRQQGPGKVQRRVIFPSLYFAEQVVDQQADSVIDVSKEDTQQSENCTILIHDNPAKQRVLRRPNGLLDKPPLSPASQLISARPPAVSLTNREELRCKLKHLLPLSPLQPSGDRIHPQTTDDNLHAISSGNSERSSVDRQCSVITPNRDSLPRSDSVCVALKVPPASTEAANHRSASLLAAPVTPMIRRKTRGPSMESGASRIILPFPSVDSSSALPYNATSPLKLPLKGTHRLDTSPQTSRKRPVKPCMRKGRFSFSSRGTSTVATSNSRKWSSQQDVSTTPDGGSSTNTKSSQANHRKEIAASNSVSSDLPSLASTSSCESLDDGSNVSGVSPAQVGFDPRVWVRVFTRPPDEKIWYTQAEMDAFQTEAIMRIRRYALASASELIPTGTGRMVHSRNYSTAESRQKVLFTHAALRDDDDEDNVESGRPLLAISCPRALTAPSLPPVLFKGATGCGGASQPFLGKMRDQLSQSEIQTILVIEPNQVFRSLLCKGLAVLVPHAAVKTASSGNEALDLMLTSNYDIIIVDHSPDPTAKVSGPMLLRKLCASSSQQRAPLLIGLALNGTVEEGQLLANGADWVWPKPPPSMTGPLLESLLKRIVAKRRRPQADLIP